MEPVVRVHKTEPSTAAIQEPLKLATQWQAAFDQVAARLGVHFSRSEIRTHAVDYLRGLLSPIERKNSWQLSEALGEITPYALQNLLGRASWDADAVRDDLRAYVIANLGDPHGVLVLDDTGFVKKGTHSVGVQRQYCGRVGKLENCQVGVFLGYATLRGHTFLDRALYLPHGWTDQPARRTEVGVPADVTFATKPQLAHTMLRRAFAARIPAAWITGDETYGNDIPLRRDLQRRRRPFVLAIRCDQKVFHEGYRQTVQAIGKGLPARAWHRLSAGAGQKGPRLYDWAFVRFAHARPKNWQRGILFRRSIEDPTDVEYYTMFAKRGTSLITLAYVAGVRWTIEESFESAKGEVGLAHYEVRSWQGWYRHITLALWAHAFLTVQRAEAPLPGGEKNFAVVAHRPRSLTRSFRTRFPKSVACSFGSVGTNPETQTMSCDGRGGGDTTRPSRDSPTTSTTTPVRRDLQL
jgi:SRSO17 transposase